MGCFNKIGFISSLPIFSGDETTLVFMIPNKYSDNKHGGVCYSTDLYEPAFLPIFGEYDDYGRIDNVKMTDSVKFIQNFFGIDIDTIIHEVDDNSVGRGGVNQCSAIKNQDFYTKLTFGLELTKVYEKMSSYKRLAYESDYNVDFWIEKLGFQKIENNSVSEKYKNTWQHSDLSGFHYHSDGTFGHLFNISTGKEHSTSTYHPKDLDEEMSKLSKTYKSKITKEDKNLCSIDLSIIHSKLAIDQYEKKLTGDPEEDFRLSIYGVSRYKGYENITTYLKRCHIDGTLYDFDSRRQPKELLKSVNNKEISDFIRFLNVLSDLNAKFQPSNYGGQEQNLKLHLEMIRCYRESITDRMSYWNEDGYYDEVLADLKSDDRDDKIVELLKHD
jgi:hypothetical protein